LITVKVDPTTLTTLQDVKPAPLTMDKMVNGDFHFLKVIGSCAASDSTRQRPSETNFACEKIQTPQFFLFRANPVLEAGSLRALI